MKHETLTFKRNEWSYWMSECHVCGAQFRRPTQELAKQAGKAHCEEMNRSEPKDGQ